MTIAPSAFGWAGRFRFYLLVPANVETLERVHLLVSVIAVYLNVGGRVSFYRGLIITHYVVVT